MRLGNTTALEIEESPSGAVDSNVVDSSVHLFVADVVKSFDIVDRSCLVQARLQF